MIKVENTDIFESGFLNGQFLIAMPSMTDSRFKRAVIYICSHSSQGAMGIVINQPAPQLRFTDLLEQLEISSGGKSIDVLEKLRGLSVYKGGPVEAGRGFVLHSSDYCIPRTTKSLDKKIYLTATLDILKDIAAGEGPQDVLFALGYTGWAPGQLEREMQENGWLNCEADAHVVFHTDAYKRYDKVLKKIGLEPKEIARFSQVVGHA